MLWTGLHDAEIAAGTGLFPAWEGKCLFPVCLMMGVMTLSNSSGEFISSAPLGFRNSFAGYADRRE